MVWPLLLACASQAPPSENGAAVSAEVCDGVDNDGNGLVDDDDPSLDPEGGVLVYDDYDGDGHGHRTNTPRRVCDPAGRPVGADDCDDTNPSVFPGAQEVCDSHDNDCDQLTDRDDPSCDHTTVRVGYLDEDGDGYAGTPVLVCGSQPDASGSADDCDDSSPEVHPGALDLCDGVDDTCQGSEVGCLGAREILGTYVATGATVASAAFGSDVAGSWVALGVPSAGESHDGLEEGVAYVLPIPTQDVDASTVATATVSGDATVQGIGALLRSRGDLDGDGFADLLAVRQTWESHGRHNVGDGGVSLFRGPLTGDLQPQWTFENVESFSSVEAGADITGDGRPDVVVGGGLVDETYHSTYGVALLDATSIGSLGPVDVATLLEVYAEGVLLHPDMDGDGLADLILGTYDGTVAVQGPIEPGSVWSDLAPVTLDAEYSGNVVLLPDLDGDGVAEVAAYGAGVAVISGRGGRRATFTFDSSVVAVPVDDLDGDGVSELAFGAKRAGIAADSAGAVWIFRGAAEGTYVQDDALTGLLGTREDQVLGSALAWTPGTLVIGDATGAWFVDTATILVP